MVRYRRSISSSTLGSASRRIARRLQRLTVNDPEVGVCRVLQTVMAVPSTVALSAHDAQEIFRRHHYDLLVLPKRQQVFVARHQVDDAGGNGAGDNLVIVRSRGTEPGIGCGSSTTCASVSRSARYCPTCSAV